MLEELIACPNADHGTLGRDGDSYRCTNCGTTFPILNGIPVLLPTGTNPNG
ncbi:MAG: Trm112 family protein [Candidatus Nanopelagicales bacterium]